MKIKNVILSSAMLALALSVFAEKQIFPRDFSPAEGIVDQPESAFRKEICLNGLWDFQPVQIPQGYKWDTGTPPELAQAQDDKWEPVKIKIPSPWNVNNWGGGQNTGEGTKQPYAPSSLYFPSYPAKWVDVRMGWLKRDFELPSDWNGKRTLIHFDAVAGETNLYVNGKHIANHFDQHLGFVADVTDALKDGKNEILLGIRHAKLFDKKEDDKKYFTGMRAMAPAGSNTDDLVGVWQDVFALSLPPVYISDVYVKPFVSKDILELEVEIKNASKQNFTGEISGVVKEWINENAALKKANSLNLDDGKVLGDRLNAVLDAAEIKWSVGKENLLSLDKAKISVKAGESAKFTIKAKVGNALKFWTPEMPNLNLAFVSLSSNGKAQDLKTTRFGWRELTFSGYDFMLNGKKIQAFGDIQHPFGPYVCSRRFAYAWYQMIKCFGGNAVRPHAQTWPKYYYDLADEMGIMVLAENGLFGSSIRPNLTQDTLWQRTKEQTERMVKRYRNNASVIGWSVGNEMFALSLKHLATIPDDEKAAWDKKLVELANYAKQLDPTRPFVTVDGDGDLDGELPVWSKHFGDGYRGGQIAEVKSKLNAPKPLVVGEFGATYYGMPPRVWKYLGDRAFESYAGRNEALAGDLYENVSKMVKPNIAYFSPSEVCWFGIEHLNYGYSDFSRLPNKDDGIFPLKKYEEGKPGYQFERIPPYIFTVNAGIDKNLPFMRPLAHYTALKAALAGKPCEWSEVKLLSKDHETRPFKSPKAEMLPNAKYSEAYFIGDFDGKLAGKLRKFGVVLNKENSKLPFVILDVESASDKDFAALQKLVKTNSSNSDFALFAMLLEKNPSDALKAILGADVKLEKQISTSLAKGGEGEISKYFHISDLYFVDAKNRRDREILRTWLSGALLKKSKIIFKPAKVNWDLFDAAEKSKCAQVVLYEHLQKPEGAALLSKDLGKGRIYVSSLNYDIETKEMKTFFRFLFRSMGLGVSKDEVSADSTSKVHDLLMDGPID